MIKDLMPFLVLNQLIMILKFECVHDEEEEGIWH
jgi:hypothetical protein